MSARARQADRSSEIDRIVGEVIRQRSSGVRVDESVLQERHPYLMPELGQRLRMLEMIGTARRHAREHPRTAASEPDTKAELDEGFGFLQDGMTDYELLKRIHYGGQGIVYKAAQRSTNRIVAVKVLLHGPLATDRQRHRFAREVDLISRLRHPNIVTLYDSGEVRGHAYFAMECIDGLPIDDYVLVRGLTVRETIGLFTTICRAVNSAHQYGIIHRDLKPSNVLVDADGQPHVLDFGLAKDLIPPEGSGEVSFTSLPGQVVGTLPYLSPEQASGLDTEVDVRSDVYSLGVVLYELLTETFPYPVNGDREVVRRNVLSREPLSLRKALSSGDSTTRVTPRDINDDLEAIVFKALEKETERRYQSAAALADDLDRWLAGDAVEAKADRRFYLLKKTVRKYRVHVAVSAAFVVLLVTALVGMTVLWQRAERNARTYQAGLKMGMLTRLGSVERDAGRLDQAAGMLEKAIELGESFPASDPTIRQLRYASLHDMAELYYEKGDPNKAEPYCNAAIELAEELVRDDPQSLRYRRSAGLSHLLGARMASSRGDWTRAAAEFETAASVYRGLIAVDAGNARLKYELAVLLGERGRCFQGLKRFDESLQCYAACCELYEELLTLEPHVADYTIELARTEGRLAVWHLHQRTAEQNQVASGWLRRAEDRLIKLRDSGRAGGRERDVRVLLGEIQRNNQLIARRHEKRTKRTLASDN